MHGQSEIDKARRPRFGKIGARMNPDRSASIHEDFFRQEEIKPSSNRNFGLTFAAFFVVVAIAPVIRGHAWRPWAFVAAAVFFAISLALPDLLRPLNKLWLGFGMLLQKVTTPVVTGLLFFSALTPIAILMRVTKQDHLRLRWDAEAKSYWIVRTPPGPAAESMKDQF